MSFNTLKHAKDARVDTLIARAEYQTQSADTLNRRLHYLEWYVEELEKWVAESPLPEPVDLASLYAEIGDVRASLPNERAIRNDIISLQKRVEWLDNSYAKLWDQAKGSNESQRISRLLEDELDRRIEELEQDLDVERTARHLEQKAFKRGLNLLLGCQLLVTIGFAAVAYWSVM